uniref:Peptidase S1 domain-containing protein n=1 Tax=Anopheles culicifacies TaxID=139723 RepID=A0A182MFC1_9DIPT
MEVEQSPLVVTEELKPISSNVRIAPLAAADTNKLAMEGYYAYPGQLPYLAQVYSKQKTGAGYIYCGGSIITTRYVLTAAICVFLRSDRSVYDTGYVLLGSAPKGDLEREQRINFTGSGISVHPSYNGTYLYDIATIRLDQAAVFNTYVQPIRLPSLADTRTFEMMEATSTAFRSYLGQIYARNQVMSNENCNLAHAYVYGQQLCTNPYIGGSFCNSVHGGPLTVEDEDGRIQIGITNWVKDCSLNSPLAHIRITYFKDWIRLNSNYIFEY